MKFQISTELARHNLSNVMRNSLKKRFHPGLISHLRLQKIFYETPKPKAQGKQHSSKPGKDELHTRLKPHQNDLISRLARERAQIVCRSNANHSTVATSAVTVNKSSRDRDFDHAQGSLLLFPTMIRGEMYSG